MHNRTIRRGSLAALFALTFLALGACGPKGPQIRTCEDVYETGLRYLEGKKWLKAQEEFELITYRYPGCDYVDDAQFMLGETYFRQKLYMEAQFEYRRVIEDFRLSDRMEDAQYRLALAAYEQSYPAALDQTATEETIFRFQQYLDDFPNGEYSDDARGYVREARMKLAQKELTTARFYERQKYQDAALIYLDHILTEFSDTGEWFEQARFLKARILADRGQRQEALALLRAIDQEQVKPRLREVVRREIGRMQSEE